jgi:Ca2+/Na+ antiporter
VLALFAGALIDRQLDYVYFPLLSFLFVMIYLNLNQSIFITKFLTYCLTILVVLTTLSANKSNKELIEKSILAYSNINLDKLWVIGGGLPTNIIFPLLTRPNQQTELITSDWSIYSPKSNFIKYNSNNNFLSELQSQQGVNVATNIYHIPLIQLYCKEKFGSDLIIKPVMNDNLIKINNLRCLGDQPRIVTPNLEFEKSGEGFLWITPDQFEFNLLNYSSTYFNESYNLVSQNNPCKKDISYTLSSSMFSITASTLQKDISIPLSLKPYEKILITISIPSGQEFCKIADDERSLVVMFKNFT